MKLTATIPRSDLANLNRAVDAVVSTSRRGLDQTLRQAARFAIQSARKETPLAKKRKMRSVERLSKKKRKEQRIPFWATHEVTSEQGGKTKKLYVRTRAAALRLRTPKYRGAAKAAWSGALAKLGNNPGRIGPAVRGLSANASAVRLNNRRGAVIGITVTNRLGYVSKVAPRAAVIGVQRATRRIEAIHLRQLDRQLEKAFRSGRTIAGRLVG